jgi:multiple sugar transport system ATP-binding protein
VNGTNGPTFESDTLRLPLTGYSFANGPDDSLPVELGIRPEHVVVEPDAPHDVAVEMTEPMGSDLLAWTRLGDRPLSIRLSPEIALKPGDRLRVRLPAQRLNLFNAATGARL